jgi:Tfp pilus assembly protein PilV
MSRLSSRGGFSVTELLISVVVIAVGVVGLTSAVGLASTEMRLGKRDTELSMLVADQLETLKGSDHDSVVSGQRVEGPYTLVWNVQGNDPKRVVLVAEYVNADGSSRADTVVTYLAR